MCGIMVVLTQKRKDENMTERKDRMDEAAVQKQIDALKLDIQNKDKKMESYIAALEQRILEKELEIAEEKAIISEVKKVIALERSRMADNAVMVTNKEAV